MNDINDPATIDEQEAGKRRETSQRQEGAAPERVGVYDRPQRITPPPALIAIIAVMLLVVAVVIIYALVF